MSAHPIRDLTTLRERCPVFRDRAHAGETLAQMLSGYRGAQAIVLAVPAGGVPVAAEIALRLGLELDLAVASKILLPWTTEAGFGAVAYDGSVWVNAGDIERFGLSKAAVQRCIEAAHAKVRHRLQRLRGGRALPSLSARPVILVDDGIAAGSTLRSAIAALRSSGAERIIVAVPTGHSQAVQLIADLADELYCANLRSGARFAVADAYEAWRDVAEDEVASILDRFAAARGTSGAAARSP